MQRQIHFLLLRSESSLIDPSALNDKIFIIKSNNVQDPGKLRMSNSSLCPELGPDSRLDTESL